jgi:hypothetical protein
MKRRSESVEKAYQSEKENSISKFIFEILKGRRKRERRIRRNMNLNLTKLSISEEEHSF